MKKFALLSLLAVSCMQTHVWQCQHITTGNVQYDSVRIVLPAYDKVNDIEVEVLKTDALCTLTLSVHGQPISSYKNNPSQTLVQVKIADQVFQELASLHSGGQKVKLSSALQEAILAHLRSGRSIEIEMSGYTRKIDADNFPSLAKNLDDPPHFRNPIPLSLDLFGN